MTTGNEKKELSREDLVLLALSPAGSVPHTPVQVQKLLFLIDRNLAPQIGGPRFDFQPYHYGPFDSRVYAILEDLARRGWVEITKGQGNWRNYRLTPTGLSHATEASVVLDERSRDYLKRVSEFVRSLSFPELVSAIYKAYPEMRARSVFQG